MNREYKLNTKIVTIAGLCLLAFQAFTQTEKGRLSLGSSIVSGGVTKNSTVHTSPGYGMSNIEYRIFDIGISPTVGRFFADNFLAGLEAQASYANTKLLRTSGSPRTYSSNDWGYSIGPFAQYFFTQGETGKPFVQLVTSIGAGESSSDFVIDNSNAEERSNYFSWAATLRMGYAVFLNDSFMISLFGGYSYNESLYDGTSLNYFSPTQSGLKVTNSRFLFGASVSTTFSKAGR